MIAPNRLARNKRGSGARVPRARSNDDQIAGVEEPGEQGEEIAAQVARAQFIASGHQQCAADSGKNERRALDARWPLTHQPQAPGGEGEARDIAEQGRIAELGQADSGVPRGKIGGEEESGEQQGPDQGAARPVRALLCCEGDQPQKRQAPKPAARTPPRPDRHRSAGRATARTPAQHCRRSAPRRPADGACVRFRSLDYFTQLAMTMRLVALRRHCEERSDEAIQDRRNEHAANRFDPMSRRNEVWLAPG